MLPQCHKSLSFPVAYTPSPPFLAEFPCCTQPQRNLSYWTMASTNARSISRRGRPEKLGQQVVQRIISSYESSSFEEIIRHIGIEGVHLQTIRNCLTNEGYCKSINCQKSRLTTGSQQLRLDFATLYRTWNLEWRTVFFATTVQFDLSENHKTKIYINKGALLCTDCKDKRCRASELQFWVIVGLH